ncbi:nitroreductase family protein [uncultured Duncaniella sp.]|uniref:nitroreductase family protein n=1 Tax=uncultured Duncaniella sp. TaxID=2768039 RepID=UPI002674A78A|nr:nitroreductase family protein [uncultured Duncaniella sp.]MCI9172968.1 nitroreductase family protein [Muribaculaceae bacterium]
MKKSVILTAFIASIMALSSCTTSSTPNATADQSTGNAALECILTRTSVRQYQPDRTISRDTVETLLRAAMSAPTAVNKQPWAFIALDDRAALDSLAQVLPYARMLTKAPLAIVTCGDLSKAIDGEDADKGFWIQDVSAATENLLLAAHAMGLGAVWTGVYPDAERVKDVQERLGLPANVIPLAVVPVGYPTGPQKPKEKWDPANVHFNKW